MVTDYSKFHLVEIRQTGLTIAKIYSILVTSFVKWSSTVKSDCSRLWLL